MNELEFGDIQSLLKAYPRLLECKAQDLHELLQQPTLIHVQGRRSPPVFVSALLHGNEPVGLYALQRIFEKYRHTELPRALSFFIGNVEAARFGVRRLDHQPDFNRVWPGSQLSPCYETGLMQNVVDSMRLRGVFASIDLHNNTGLNPHYTCISDTSNEFLQLASLFGRTVVYFQTPSGVQTMAFAGFCPAVTCECGRVDDLSGIQHAFEFVDATLHLETFPQQAVHAGDIHLFHTLASLNVPEHCSMSFDATPADIQFVADLDHMNFVELEPGTCLAQLSGLGTLRAYNETGADISAELLQQQNNQVLLKRRLMPAMLTLDEKIIRQDCLGYLMERMEI